MSAKPQPTWQNKAIAALKSDPKKTGVMSVLAVVLAVMAGRAALGDKAGPAASLASVPSDAPIQADTGSAFKTSGKKDTSAAMRMWLSAPPTKIGRNLFAVNVDFYPQAAGKPARPANPADQDKSALQDADDLKQQDAQLAVLKQAAGQLKLQSTMMGAHPQAMIDGSLFKVGDRINPGAAVELTGFKLLKIEPRRVWIGKDAIKLSIEMK